MKNTSIKSRKKRVFDIIQIGNKDDLPSRGFDIFIVVVIITNIVVMFLQTFSQLAPAYKAFRIVEQITLGIFCVEYVLRIWTAEYLYPELSRGKAALKFIFSFEGIVDFLTILPFFFLSGFVAFRMLRVVRIFHLFRINAVYDSFNVITSVLKEKKVQLLFSLFIIFVLMMASSLIMYSAEHAAQPDKFKDAFSGIWWSVSALLTVGYGDIYPVTVVGQIFAILTAMLGVGAVAIPTGIISAGFVEHYSRLKEENVSEQTSFGIMNILMVWINIDSGWIGLSVPEVEEFYDVRIISCRRDEETMYPDENYKVAYGDTLAVCKIPPEKRKSGGTDA